MGYNHILDIGKCDMFFHIENNTISHLSILLHYYSMHINVIVMMQLIIFHFPSSLTTCFDTNWPSSGALHFARTVEIVLILLTSHAQHQHSSGGNEQAGANETSASRENKKPLLYEPGSCNTRTRQVDDAPVSGKILKF
jgi:hypothetical protein